MNWLMMFSNIGEKLVPISDKMSDHVFRPASLTWEQCLQSNGEKSQCASLELDIFLSTTIVICKIYYNDNKPKIFFYLR
jgi:hypothetical protein